MRYWIIQNSMMRGKVNQTKPNQTITLNQMIFIEIVKNIEHFTETIARPHPMPSNLNRISFWKHLVIAKIEIPMNPLIMDFCVLSGKSQKRVWFFLKKSKVKEKNSHTILPIVTSQGEIARGMITWDSVALRSLQSSVVLCLAICGCQDWYPSCHI